MRGHSISEAAVIALLALIVAVGTVKTIGVIARHHFRQCAERIR